MLHLVAQLLWLAIGLAVATALEAAIPTLQGWPGR